MAGRFSGDHVHGRFWVFNEGECSILWKNSSYYLRNLIPPGVFATDMVDFNRRALPTRAGVLDWFGTQKQD